jgi:hypothetical protein
MWWARLDRDRKRGTTMNADTIHSDRNATADVITMAARASGAGAFDVAEDPAKGAGNQRLIGVWNGPTAIRHIYPYALFNKSPLQLRRIGALGGKAHGRNQRARRALLPALQPAIPLRAAAQQSTAEAIAVLDARFPWLQRAEQRRCPNTPSRSSQPHSHHFANQDSTVTG